MSTYGFVYVHAHVYVYVHTNRLKYRYMLCTHMPMNVDSQVISTEKGLPGSGDVRFWAFD